jgi:hypothetical protein
MKALLNRRAAIMSLVLCMAVGKAVASPYTFTQIATTAGGPLPFASFGISTSINAQGTVAFRARLLGGGSGIFTGDGLFLGTVQTTVKSPFGITAFGLNAGGLNINSAGTVAFLGSNAAVHGIFIGSSGAFPAGGPAGLIMSSAIADFDDPVINNKGELAWRLTNAITGFNGIAVATKNGIAPSFIADNLASPGGVKRFSPILSINSSGVVAFEADLMAGGESVFATAAPLGAGAPPLFGTTTLLPMLPAAMMPSDLFAPFINDGGTIAFLAEFPGNKAGIFTRDPAGRFTLIANTGGLFSGFRRTSLSINSAGTVAFEAPLAAGGEGIFTGPNMANEVIGTGDPLFGSTVSTMYFTRGMTDTGEIAFEATLTDGIDVVVRADPVPEPPSWVPFGVGIGVSLLVHARRCRNQPRLLNRVRHRGFSA